MLSHFCHIQRSASIIPLIKRSLSVAAESASNTFKRNILETVVPEINRDCYTTLVSATSESLLDGYLETIQKDDRLLVISNGFDGDRIAKKAVSKGINTLWTYHSMLYPLDAEEVAQDIIHHHAITHVLLVSTESFTGAMTPLRQILKNARRVRRDVSICVDNRNGFLLQPMPNTDDIIDYSIHDTHILGLEPSFGFMVAHKPAIIAESELHPTHLLSSMYNKHMHLERMIPSVQEKYNQKMSDDAWRTLVYQYEETKAQIVNKVKLLLPAIPRGMDQSSYSACFLVPQEVARLRELLESLKDFGIPVDHRFATNGLPMISFDTGSMIQYEERGGELLDIYKGIERVLRRRASEFFHDSKLLKEEEKYRQKQIYGENIQVKKSFI